MTFLQRLRKRPSKSVKPPFREWRLLHRAKLAKRSGDIELLNRLAAEYSKLLRSG